MAHEATHTHDYDPDEALHRLQSERSSRTWIALILFLVSAAAVAGSFYLAYRELPTPPPPADNAPGLGFP